MDAKMPGNGHGSLPVNDRDCQVRLINRASSVTDERGSQRVRGREKAGKKRTTDQTWLLHRAQWMRAREEEDKLNATVKCVSLSLSLSVDGRRSTRVSRGARRALSIIGKVDFS